MKRMTAGKNVNRRARNRGIGVMFIFGAMIVMGAAIVAMSALFGHELQRTRGVAAGAQVRQLLMAGVPQAQAELAARGDTARDVDVPTPVAGATLTLHVLPGQNGTVEVVARAGYHGFRGEQAVDFSRSADGEWRVSDVRLVRSGGATGAEVGDGNDGH